MSEDRAIAFHKLVAAMRTSEKEFWKSRSKYALRQSIELERRVDGIISQVDSKSVPDSDNGKFYLAVSHLRNASDLYFAEKKKSSPDPEQKKLLFKTVREYETLVDNLLVKWQDKQAILAGKRIKWTIMERFARSEAHPCFSTYNEQLARIHYNDYLRRPSPGGGCMYFLTKEYEDVKK